MPDREIIVKWFEFCRVEDKCSTDCPYFDNTGSARECTNKLAKDVLTLLKEQEAQSVIVREKPKNGNILWFADCPKCKHGIERDKHKHFCGFCGKAVKWG